MEAKPYIQHDPIVGYIYRPGISLDLQGPEERYYRLAINLDGLRSDKRYSFSKPAGTFRILAFGDSYCAGQYLNNQERFSERMEALCPGLEVLNFGLEGTGTDQQLLMFEHYGLKYDFDLVMVCPFIENIRRNLANYRVALDPGTKQQVLVPKPRFELIEGHLKLRGVPIPARKIPFEEASKDLWAQTDFAGSAAHPSLQAQMKSLANGILSALRLKNTIYRMIPREPFPEYKNPSSSSWLLMSAILRRFKELSGSRPLVVAPLVYDSYLYHRMASHYIRRFHSLEENPGIYFVNALPYFRHLTGAEIKKCFLSNDCHYSPFAHRILADALLAELNRLKLLPR